MKQLTQITLSFKTTTSLFKILPLFFFFFNIDCIAQKENLNELEKKLKQSSCNEKIDLLNKLADLGARSSIQKSFSYSEEALKLSINTGYEFGRAQALHNLGFLYYLKNDLIKAESYYKKAKIYFENNQKEKDLASVINNLGLIYWKRNQYVSAFKYYKESLAISQKNNYKYLTADALNYIGLIYWKWSQYAKALDYFFNSLRIKEDLNDNYEIGLSLNNIAFIYNEMNQTDLSIYYSSRVLDITNKLNDNYVLGRALNNLGVSYLKRKDYEKAEYYQIESLRIKEEIGDKLGMGYSLNDLGDLDFVRKNYPLAIKHYKEALTIRRDLKDEFGIASTLLSLSRVYNVIHNNSSAVANLKEGLSIAQEIGNISLEASLYKELANTQFNIGNIKLAYEYLELNSNLIEELYAKETRDKIAELTVIYDVDSKQNQIKIQELELEKEQSKTTFIYIIIVLGFFVLFILVLRNRRLIKIRNELVEKNQVIDEKTKELEKAITSRDKFFSIISHDLRSPFFGLRGIAEILSDNYDSLEEEERTVYAKKLSRSVKEVYSLLENLLEWSRLQSKRMEFNPDVYDLYEDVAYVFFLLNPNAEQKQISLINKVESPVMIFADQQMVHSVLLNLITNAIKFTPEGGSVTVESSELENKIKISVKDTGVGISPDIKEKLFQLDAKVTSRGTNDEKGTGLGLILCKELININGGEIFFDTKIDAGTTFNFTLPKSPNN